LIITTTDRQTIICKAENVTSQIELKALAVAVWATLIMYRWSMEKGEFLSAGWKYC